MAIAVELSELRVRLEEVGMVVVEEPDYLVVRLPYFCSVRISFNNGRLRFESFLGIQPRTRATLLKLGGLGAGALIALRLGLPYALSVAILALLAGIYDVFRVTLTENVTTRASLIFAQIRDAERLAARATGGGASVVPPQRARELNAGPAGTAERERGDELPRGAIDTIINRR